MGKWTADNIPNLKGKTVIVTGATSGIGKEAAKVLMYKNATTVLAIRNLEKGENVKKEFLQEYPNGTVHLMKLDLSDLDSVHSFVTEFKKLHSKLDYLVNNAGVMMPPYGETKDGFELQMGTNHFGHFALTGLLLPLLKQSKGRIVNVASVAHRAGNIDFEDIHWKNRKYDRTKAYGDSKIANLYFTYELDRYLKSHKIDVKVNAAHPGWTATDLQRHMGMLAGLNFIFGQKPWKGALPTLRALFDENLSSGEYYGPRGLFELGGYPKKVKSNKKSHDKDIAKKLFTVSEELTKVNY